MRIRESSLPNKNFASVFAKSVFPTPVGPKKINEPKGRLPEETPALLRRTADEISFIACS